MCQRSFEVSGCDHNSTTGLWCEGLCHTFYDVVLTIIILLKTDDLEILSSWVVKLTAEIELAQEFESVSKLLPLFEFVKGGIPLMDENVSTSMNINYYSYIYYVYVNYIRHTRVWSRRFLISCIKLFSSLPDYNLTKGTQWWNALEQSCIAAMKIRWQCRTFGHQFKLGFLKAKSLASFIKSALEQTVMYVDCKEHLTVVQKLSAYKRGACMVWLEIVSLPTQHANAKPLAQELEDFINALLLNNVRFLMCYYPAHYFIRIVTYGMFRWQLQLPMRFTKLLYF